MHLIKHFSGVFHHLVLISHQAIFNAFWDCFTIENTVYVILPSHFWKINLLLYIMS